MEKIDDCDQLESEISRNECISCCFIEEDTTEQKVRVRIYLYSTKSSKYSRIDGKCQKESSILFLISSVHNIIMKKVVSFRRYEVVDEFYRKKTQLHP